MGVTGFFQWLQTVHKYEPKEVKIEDWHTKLVELKMLIHKVAAGIPPDVDDFEKECAKKIMTYFPNPKVVVFVNDGNERVTPLKLETKKKRMQHLQKEAEKAKEKKIAYEKDETIIKKRKLERVTFESPLVSKAKEAIFDSPVGNVIQKIKTQSPDEQLHEHGFSFQELLHTTQLEEDLEKAQKWAREISTQTTKRVLQILDSNKYETVQCDGEADPIMVLLSPYFDFVVSEDSDLIIGGVNNMVRYYGTKNLLYADVLSFLKMDTTQLKVLSAFSGCDYTPGIKGIGLKRAEGFMKKHGTPNNFLRSVDAQKYKADISFLPIVDRVVQQFTPKWSHLV